MLKIVKNSSLHKTISFVVLVPDEVDFNWDKISEDEIIKTAHEFMINIQDKFLNIDHKDWTKIDKSKYAFVENFIAPNDIIVWDEIVKKWSWYVWIKFFDDEIYNDILNWKYVGVSMEGYIIKD